MLLMAAMMIVSSTAMAAPAVKAKSWAAVDHEGHLIAGKQVDEARPIASITKLMTAMVYLDAKMDLSVKEKIEADDVDLIKNSSSRLEVGDAATREELLRMALASSENRAASALSRSYPGGKEAFVRAMNEKAKSLGLHSAKFVDPTGLDPRNIASARDVAKLALAARDYPMVRQAAESKEYEAMIETEEGEEPIGRFFVNTSRPLREGKISLLISKTGYIREAGRCLSWALERPSGSHVGLALLGSPSLKSRDVDEIRLSRWARQQQTQESHRRKKAEPKKTRKGEPRSERTSPKRT